METHVGSQIPRDRAGGFAALYLAAAYAAAMPYFLLVVRYPEAVEPAAKVAMLVGHHDSMRVMYLATYVVFGLALAVLTLTLDAHLRERAPILSRGAMAVGLVWSLVLVASGLIFNAGMAAVVALQASSPEQAASLWQAVEPVAQGLGGADGELLGGLWVLLVSVATLRGGAAPRGLCRFGIVVGAAGVLSIVPTLREAGYAFGVLQLAWFAWLGVVLLRAPREP